MTRNERLRVFSSVALALGMAIGGGLAGSSSAHAGITEADLETALNAWGKKKGLLDATTGTFTSSHTLQQSYDDGRRIDISGTSSVELYNNANNAGTVLLVTKNPGTNVGGHAAQFITGTSATESCIYGSHNGAGDTLELLQGGTGRSIHVQHSSDNEAVRIFTNNTGAGGYGLRMEGGTGATAPLIELEPGSNQTYAVQMYSGAYVYRLGRDGTVRARVPITAKTSNYTVQAEESGTTFTTTGASSTVVFTLPTWVSGLRYTFTSDAAQILTVDAPGTDVIRFGDSVTSAGGTFSTTTSGRGNSITVESTASGAWTVVAATGSTWN